MAGDSDTPAKTMASAWIAVILMIVGFALCALALPWRDARVALLVAGGVIGLAGIIIAGAANIMDHTE